MYKAEMSIMMGQAKVKYQAHVHNQCVRYDPAQTVRKPFFIKDLE